MLTLIVRGHNSLQERFNHVFYNGQSLNFINGKNSRRNSCWKFFAADVCASKHEL